MGRVDESLASVVAAKNPVLVARRTEYQSFMEDHTSRHLEGRRRMAVSRREAEKAARGTYDDGQHLYVVKGPYGTLYEICRYEHVDDDLWFLAESFALASGAAEAVVQAVTPFGPNNEEPTKPGVKLEGR